MTERVRQQGIESAVLGVDLESINLEQALIDFEIANARVLDLTRRLTSLTAETMQLRSENERQRLQIRDLEFQADAARREVTEIRASLAYRAARVLGDVRARVRR